MKLNKFKAGTFVQIAKDLGPSMSHFDNDRPAMVLGTYAQLHRDNDRKSYQLFVRQDNGQWRSVAWYYESQLAAITDQNDLYQYEMEIKLLDNKPVLTFDFDEVF